MNMPALVRESLMPKIIWYQTDVSVVVRIMLSDVKVYHLSVEYDYFIFGTTVHDKRYCVCMSFFGPVIPEKTWHSNLGREVKIYLYKVQKWYDWPRLYYQQQKNPFVTYDVDHMKDAQKEKRWSMHHEKRIPFSEYKRLCGITNIMPDVPSSDEDESDDEKYDAFIS